MSSQFWPCPPFISPSYITIINYAKQTKSDCAASSQPLLLLCLGRWAHSASHCWESACQIHLLNHQGHTVTAWCWDMEWSRELLAERSCTPPPLWEWPALGRLLMGFRPQKLAGGWAGGVEKLHPKLLWEIILVVPGVTQKRSILHDHKSLFLHCLNSMELEGLLTIIPEFQDHVPKANFLSSLKFQDEQLCCSLARQQLPLYATCLAYISTLLLKK